MAFFSGWGSVGLAPTVVLGDVSGGCSVGPIEQALHPRKPSMGNRMNIDLRMETPSLAGMPAIV
jgi:hypothetical protein